MASDYNRRASHAESQFSADTQTLVNKYEEAIQSLEGRYQRELRELLELQREEKAQWEFERDEIAQEVAEAHEQLKESLANEKAASVALRREKELLEKKLKEEVNVLVCEKEQLRKELQELRDAAEERERKLSSEMLQLQSDHEKELKDREERLNTVEDSGKLVSQRLERLNSEYKREKEELNSKLLALESLNKDICVKAEAEKAEMSLEISNLQEKVQKLQWENLSFSALRDHYRVLEKEYAKAKSRIAAFSGREPVGDDADVLTNLQRVHEQAVKENVRMAAEIVRLQQRLRDAECRSMGHGQPDCSDPAGLPCGCGDESKGEDLDGFQLLEADTADLKEGMGSGLEEPCDGSGVDSGAPEVWVCHVPGGKMALESDCNPDLDKDQEVVSQVPLLQKKRDLERGPRLKILQNGIKQQNVSLLSNRAAPKSKSFHPDASKLHAELKHVKELERAPGSMNGDLQSAIPQLWERVEELQDRLLAQARLLSLQEEIQAENEGLKSEVMKLVEKNRVLEDTLCELRSFHCELEGSDLGSRKLWEENTQLPKGVREWTGGQTQSAGGEIDVSREELRLQCQLGKPEERVAVLKVLQDGHAQCDSTMEETPTEKRGLQEHNGALEEVPTLVNPNGMHLQEEERNTVMYGLQSTCTELQQKVDLLR